MMTPKKLVRPAYLLRFAAPIVLGLAGLLGACQNPNATLAQLGNFEDPFQLHALSGSPLIYPSALAIASRAPAHVDGTFAFDVAFDIDATGRIVLLPVSLVGQNPQGQRVVGLQVMGGTFENIGSAPTAGYNSDSVTYVKPGQPVTVQSAQIACQGQISPYLYAKFVVDSVNTPSRTLYGRMVVDINCGFRQLNIGLPTF
jgi:hypothetical protein